jgi:hypothetical protein
MFNAMALFLGPSWVRPCLAWICAAEPRHPNQKLMVPQKFNRNARGTRGRGVAYWSKHQDPCTKIQWNCTRHTCTDITRRSSRGAEPPLSPPTRRRRRVRVSWSTAGAVDQREEVASRGRHGGAHRWDAVMRRRGWWRPPPVGTCGTAPRPGCTVVRRQRLTLGGGGCGASQDDAREEGGGGGWPSPSWPCRTRQRPPPCSRRERERTGEQRGREEGSGTRS